MEPEEHTAARRGVAPWSPRPMGQCPVAVGGASRLTGAFSGETRISACYSAVGTTSMVALSRVYFFLSIGWSTTQTF